RALNVSQTLVHFMVRDAERHCAECLDACHRGVACPVFLGGRARPPRNTGQATPRWHASRHSAQWRSASRTMKCTSVCDTFSAR
ncbi:hypothetical protein QM326_39320, partial [Burkholderia cenocepacia]|nr:hypothetical protein [Burkholderia cenocepacia]